VLGLEVRPRSVAESFSRNAAYLRYGAVTLEYYGAVFAPISRHHQPHAKYQLKWCPSSIGLLTPRLLTRVEMGPGSALLDRVASSHRADLAFQDLFISGGFSRNWSGISQFVQGPQRQRAMSPNQAQPCAGLVAERRPNAEKLAACRPII
jgi:hypothetical protein